MHLSVRSKVGAFFSLFAILTMVSALIVAFATHGTAAHAASGPSASYKGTPIHGQRLAYGHTLPAGHMAPAAKPQGPRAFRQYSPTKPGSHASASMTLVNSASSTTAGSRSLLHNFNGLSDVNQSGVNGGPGFEVTPPDQGLCVGHDASLAGSPKAVFETINDAVRETNTSGKQLRPDFSMRNFFGDPNAFSDPRCFYDKVNATFFFTVISCATCTTDTVTDLLVINTNGIAFYQFDSSFAATCFGDQPHVGYDDNALYISTDEFCGPGQNTYAGALLIAISKPQLVSEAPKVNAQTFGLLSLGGIPVLTLEPAVTVGGSNTEYLLNSFPMDAAGNNLPSSNNLGFWSVTNDQAITTGVGTAVLTGKLITSETYFFPVPAASTGTGTASNVCGFIPGVCVPILSEAALNPDDDRMLQVEAFNQNGKIHLWAALDSALNIAGDTSTRDAAAWFRIDAASQSVVQQGFVASKGNNLLYPAIMHSNSGATTMTFTITGPGRNPSAAWTSLDLAQSSSSAIHIAGFGSSAHISFSDLLPPQFGPRPRWGDYSAAVLDPDNNGIWMATEYIPPRHDQDPIDNWGTYVFEAA